MLTDIVAWLALVVAFISLYISWLTFKRDRSDLRISLDFHLESGQGTAFQVSVVNSGRRSTYVQKVSLRHKSGKELVYRAHGSPIILEEAQVEEYWFPLTLEPDVHSPLDIKGVKVYDTLGNKYTFPSTMKSRLDFFLLKRQIAKALVTAP